MKFFLRNLWIYVVVPMKYGVITNLLYGINKSLKIGFVAVKFGMTRKVKIHNIFYVTIDINLKPSLSDGLFVHI